MFFQMNDARGQAVSSHLKKYMIYIYIHTISLCITYIYIYIYCVFLNTYHSI